MTKKKTKKEDLDIPVPVKLDVVDKQALLSITAEVQKIQAHLQERTELQEQICQRILERHEFPKTHWIDVTNLEHGTIRISREDPHKATAVPSNDVPKEPKKAT